MVEADFYFTNDWWFSSHFSVWERIITQLKPKNILEIGSFEGQSTVFLADIILGKQLINTQLHIVCIDTWQGSREHLNTSMSKVEELFDQNLHKLKSKYSQQISIQKIKSKSSVALTNLYALNNHIPTYDFIYVDGSHDASDVLFDAVLSFSLLKEKGVICFDDFLWHSKDRNPLHTPRLAIESFINCNRDKIFLFDSGQSRQCWLQKCQDEDYSIGDLIA